MELPISYKQITKQVNDGSHIYMQGGHKFTRNLIYNCTFSVQYSLSSTYSVAGFCYNHVHILNMH